MLSHDHRPNPQPPALPSVWNLFGMRTSPYAPEAPGAENSRDDLDAFVGRQSELAELTSYVHGCHGSRIPIVGAAGVGKTAFVRALSARLRADEYWSTSELVIPIPGESADALISRALTVVSRTIIQNGRASTDTVAMQEVQSALAAWDPEREVAPFYLMQAQRLLHQIITNTYDNESRGVILHLKIPADLDAASIALVARRLLDLRDSMLLMPGLHVLLTGTRNAVAEAVAKRSQMSSIFRMPTYVEPLSISEVLTLLQHRYEAAARGANQPVTAPVDPAVVAYLCESLAGNLKAMLQTLDGMVTQWLTLGGHTRPGSIQPLSLVTLRKMQRAKRSTEQT